jgi:hypothetical protein
MTVVRFRSDWIGPSGPTRRHCAMFNQSNPRLWFLGIVLTGLFPIESLDLECWRLGGIGRRPVRSVAKVGVSCE